MGRWDDEWHYERKDKKKRDWIRIARYAIYGGFALYIKLGILNTSVMYELSFSVKLISFPKLKTSTSTITYSYSRPMSMIFSEMTAEAHLIFAIHGIQ